MPFLKHAWYKNLEKFKNYPRHWGDGSARKLLALQDEEVRGLICRTQVKMLGMVTQACSATAGSAGAGGSLGLIG